MLFRSTLSNLRSSALRPPLLQLLVTIPHAENEHETENEANCKEINWGSGPEMVFVLSFMLGDTSIPPTILVLSGHDIFESLFRPILRSFLECFFFHFSNVPFMTLTISQFTIQADLLWEVLTVYRTKRGSIK